MKKVVRLSITFLLIILCIVFSGDIKEYITQNDTVQNLKSKVLGVNNPDTSVIEHGNSYYAYSTLNDNEKLVYNQMADCLLNFEEETTLSAATEEESDKAYQCLMYDHPEIFWSNAYELNTYNLSGVDSEYVFRPRYTLTREQVSARQEEIDRYVSECLADMPQSGTDYDKAKYLYDYIILHTDYDASSQDNQNICSVFIDRKSVCMGYSKAYSYLLGQAGIESVVVAGMSRQESHAWNLVRLDGSYCYIDITWGDPAFSSDQTVSDSYIDYVFFGITTQELLKTHTPDDIFPLADCTDTGNNYFRREGLYLEQFDEDKVADMIEQHFAQHSYVSIQASGNDVYGQLYDYLIGQSKIADFITGNKVSYAENTDYYTLTIFKPSESGTANN